MFIRSFKISKKIFIFCSILIFTIASIFVYSFAISATQETPSEKKDFIKWVDFNVSCQALLDTSKLDIDSHQNETEDGIVYNWIELLAYLACKNGGNFKNYSKKDLNNLITQLKNGQNMSDLTSDLKFYDYYYESYSAVLGNDLMGSIGTPIIAVESGIVEHLGWNQYGGWRVGIRSFDGKRYYYYAHLRKNHPYVENLEEGSIVKAGDVIGYLGMTGYSVKENVNNINVPHLHFGLQLIFDESQVDSPNEIWIDVYQIVEFLKKNRSSVYMANSVTKDYARKFDFMEKNLEE